ncbi:hypothetical protein [Kistimonas asteriae]|uniref:hypothetical protein n=1 Tax=Kistimonas asteriae TaxID=517724 RepID=UPI001BA74B15|nr:hypothetical protein [Kistimonas asteriae]
MTITKPLLLVLLFLLLTGCGKPLPENRMNYAGYWTSNNMVIAIHPDGTVNYQRIQGRTTTTVNGPLAEFVGDDFVVGIGFLTTTFNVSEPPTQADGIWQMTVDGVRLTKGESPEEP